MAQDQSIQFAAIKSLIKSGDIETAREQLQAMGGPKAIRWLEELNSRYPISSTHIPGLLGEAKRLIAIKDYEGAEKLLWDSDAPEAGELLRKLKLVQSIPTSSRSKAVLPAKAKSAAEGRSQYTLIAASVCILLVLGLIAFAIYQVQKPSNIKAQLEAICSHWVTALDSDHEISEGAITAACRASAEKTWAAAPGHVEYCVGTYSSDNFDFHKCLREGNVSFMDFTLESLKS